MSEYTDYAGELEPETPSTNLETAPPSEQHFPVKLHFMLSELELDKMSHIIGWQPHGRGFLVHNQKLFVDAVLPGWFRQTKFPSFQRQLNLYGFQRISSGLDKGAYYHELFLRNKAFLAHRIRRKKRKGEGHRKASSPESEINLYSFPALPPLSPSYQSTPRFQTRRNGIAPSISTRSLPEETILSSQSTLLRQLMGANINPASSHFEGRMDGLQLADAAANALGLQRAVSGGILLPRRTDLSLASGLAAQLNNVSSQARHHPALDLGVSSQPEQTDPRYLLAGMRDTPLQLDDLRVRPAGFQVKNTLPETAPDFRTQDLLASMHMNDALARNKIDRLRVEERLREPQAMLNLLASRYPSSLMVPSSNANLSSTTTLSQQPNDNSRQQAIAALLMQAEHNRSLDSDSKLPPK